MIMSESELLNLYSRQILALAAAIPHLGRLPAPTGTATRRAPLCGSTVTADVVMRDGRIEAFAQDVRACALGQASAAILGSAIVGLDRPALAAARSALADLLAGGDPTLPPGFETLSLLRAARDYSNRHASILLAFDTALAAIDA